MNQQPTRHELAYQAWDRAYFGNLGIAELLSEQQCERYKVAAAATANRLEREVVDLLSGVRLRQIDAEIAQRTALFEAGADVPDPHDRISVAWVDLAQRVRAEADIVHLIRLAGYPLEPAGRAEWSGPCPVCGGRDRFRVWGRESGSHPRYWCRRCNISGDAISVFRDLLQPGASFFDALRWIGLELGIFEPADFGTKRPRRIDLGEIRPRVGELRRVG